MKNLDLTSDRHIVRYPVEPFVPQRFGPGGRNAPRQLSPLRGRLTAGRALGLWRWVISTRWSFGSGCGESLHDKYFNAIGQR